MLLVFFLECLRPHLLYLAVSLPKPQADRLQMLERLPLLSEKLLKLALELTAEVLKLLVKVLRTKTLPQPLLFEVLLE